MKIFQQGKRYTFQIVCGLLIVFAISPLSKHTDSHEFVHDVEVNNANLLLSVMRVKLTFVSLYDLKIDLVNERVSELIDVMEKLENTLMLSLAASSGQAVLLKLSQWPWFNFISVILLLGTLMSQSIQCKRCLMMILAINPGLVLTVLLTHQLSDLAKYDAGAKLQGELSSISKGLMIETRHLIQLHESDVSDLEFPHSPAMKAFFEKLKADLLKNSKSIGLDDYKVLRAVIKSGVHNIMLGIIYFSVHVFLFSILLPILYFKCLSRLFVSFYQTELEAS